MATETSRAERFADWLDRNKLWLFAVWLLHTIFIHYQLIGFMSWDGFGYRTTPVIELMTTGSTNAHKFADWPMVGHTPFIELLHIPFLKLFGMRGLLLGFPIVAFPLCTSAVFLLMRELTGSKRGGTLGAFAYVAIPMVNQQPFTGYVDFAVTGMLALWLYAMARLRSEERPSRRWGRLAVATFLLTMARSQAPYIIVILAPVLFYAMRMDRRLALRAAGVLLIGASPAIALQIYKFVVYGSPIWPMQFQFLGITIGKGVPMSDYFHYAGLGGADFGSLAKAAFEGWIWHADWPVGAFFASRYMAAGLLGIAAVVLLPIFLRSATRLEKFMLLGGAAVSLLSRDFAVPRWSYTTTLALAVIIGRALLALCESKGRKVWFWIAFGVVALHLLRPEFDILQIRAGNISSRMNVTRSKMFITTDHGDELHLYPNRHFEIAVLEGTQFSLQFYGQTLTNSVLGTIPGKDVGENCEGLRSLLTEHPKALFVDDQHVSAKCQRGCVVSFAGWYCALWQIGLPATSQQSLPRE